MKTFTLISAVLLLASSALAAAPLKAGYQITLTKGKHTWDTKTVVPIEAGKPVRQGLGPYVVSMTVKEDTENKYTLLVSVIGKPGSTTAHSEFIHKSFRGTHTKQLEFATSKAGLALKGVIFVGPLKSAAM